MHVQSLLLPHANQSTATILCELKINELCYFKVQQFDLLPTYTTNKAKTVKRVNVTSYLCECEESDFQNT